MTPETLRELEALYERATPGVWSTDHSGLVTGGEYEQIAKGGKIQCISDARWIVALHNRFPALLAEIRRLEVERDALKAECERLRAALRAIQQRANERRGTGLIAERDTVYAMHDLARAALTPSEKEKQT